MKKYAERDISVPNSKWITFAFGTLGNLEQSHSSSMRVGWVKNKKSGKKSKVFLFTLFLGALFVLAEASRNDRWTRVPSNNVFHCSFSCYILFYLIFFAFPFFFSLFYFAHLLIQILASLPGHAVVHRFGEWFSVVVIDDFIPIELCDKISRLQNDTLVSLNATFSAVPQSVSLFVIMIE